MLVGLRFRIQVDGQPLLRLDISKSVEQTPGEQLQRAPLQGHEPKIVFSQIAFTILAAESRHRTHILQPLDIFTCHLHLVHMLSCRPMEIEEASQTCSKMVMAPAFNVKPRLDAWASVRILAHNARSRIVTWRIDQRFPRGKFQVVQNELRHGTWGQGRSRPPSQKPSQP